jgi:hypothetical protein
MNVAVVRPRDRRWRSALARQVQDDVYFLPELHEVYEAQGDGHALAFVAEDAGDVLVHPFMLRPIERVGAEELTGLADIESINGYSGPLATTGDRSFLDAAWDAFQRWCLDAGVVAEFIRFHPLLANHLLAPATAQVTADRDMVVLSLESGLWERYPSVQRNMVRKAEKLGLEVVDDGADWDAFVALYAESMQRLESRAAVRFGPDYFSALRECLGDDVKLFAAYDGDVLVAGAVFMLHGSFAHYHLAASDTTLRRSSGAGNLLLHRGATWAAARGATVMHLGGGRTTRPDDELLRFKRSVSSERRPYCLGRVVHDEERMDDLKARWLAQAGDVAPPSHFFAYRLDPITGARL